MTPQPWPKHAPRQPLALLTPLALAATLWLLMVLLFQAQPTDAQPPAGHAIFLPLAASSHPVVRISALHYDTQVSDEPDEAFQLWNVSNQPANLAGYQVSDGRRTVVFPALTLPAGSGLWCTRHAVTFTHSFGFAPGCEYGVDSDPNVPNLSGSALRFANTGGQARLLNPAGALVDVLVYEGGDSQQAGWQGATAQPYAPSSSFPAEGQILYRKRDWDGALPGQPWPDSDRRGDWAQDPDDPWAGRRVQYPGWDLDTLGQSPLVQASAALTVALGPDNLFDVVSRTLASAQRSLYLEGYSLEHVALAELLAAKATAGVSVTILLEGSPAGGIADQQRYATQLIEAGGGQVWFMVEDRNDAHARYAYQHAKFIVVDERLLLVSSENFTPDSMPDDDKADGTLGRRGTALLSDAPQLVAQALAVFRADFDPAHHADLFRWQADDPKYGAPPPGFQPNRDSGGAGYAPLYPLPLAASGVFTAQLLHAPETSLLPPHLGGLLGLVERAGPGDTVLVQQLYEHVHWGSSSDTPASAPNLRLAAYIAAARRGAAVRLLLDSFFQAGQNGETAAYVNQLAQAEGLDLVALLGNPTGLGIHNKMVLVQAGGQGWAHVGSINGSEASAKANRELALDLQSTPVYDYLAAAFWQDWLVSGGSR